MSSPTSWRSSVGRFIYGTIAREATTDRRDEDTEIIARVEPRLGARVTRSTCGSGRRGERLLGKDGRRLGSTPNFWRPPSAIWGGGATRLGRMASSSAHPPRRPAEGDATPWKFRSRWPSGTYPLPRGI